MAQVGQILKLMDTTILMESTCRLNIVLVLHQEKMSTPQHQSDGSMMLGPFTIIFSSIMAQRQKLEGITFEVYYQHLCLVHAI